MESSTGDPGFWFGALGVLILAGMFIGGYQFAKAIWDSKPIAEIKSVFPAISVTAKGETITKVVQVSKAASKQSCPEPQPEIATLQKKNDDLARELEVSKHSLTDQDVQNIQFVFQAFTQFRKAIGQDAKCLVKATSSADKLDHQMAYSVLQLSHLASNCEVMGPQNFDADPDLEKEAMDGAIPGKIILHASRDQKGAADLYGSLNFVLRVTRSYDIPKGSKDNFVWLQFGQGAHFNN